MESRCQTVRCDFEATARSLIRVWELSADVLLAELVARISLAEDPLALRTAIRGANKVGSLAEFRLTGG